jgi:hypothetical protein
MYTMARLHLYDQSSGTLKFSSAKLRQDNVLLNCNSSDVDIAKRIQF